MISLDFNNTAFHGTTGTAFLFQTTAQLLELGGTERQAGDNRHPGTFTAFGFPPYPDNAIAFRDRCLRFAGTGGLRVAAVGTDPAVFRGINWNSMFSGFCYHFHLVNSINTAR